MFNWPFSLSRMLLLIAFLAGASFRCLAQEDLDFSFVPQLTPSLSDTNPNTAPTTTLSIDLLAAQRSFTYDGTGASIFANALDPSVRVDVYATAAETDTEVRDSIQTGQISPYGYGSSRLATLFSSAGSTTRSGNSPAPASAIAQPSTAAYMDYGQPYGTEAPTADTAGSGASSDNAYRSSWGSSYGSASSVSASSWGDRGTAVERSGAGSSTAGGTSSSIGSGYESGSSLSSAQSSAMVEDQYRYRPVSTIGWSSSGLTRSRPTANFISTTISRGVTTFGAGSTDRFVARPGQMQDPYGPVQNMSVPAAGMQPPSLAHDFALSPRPEPVAPGDASPFSSFGDLDLLQPDILSIGRASRSRNEDNASSKQRRSPDDTDDDRDNPLETSGSHYGLISPRKTAPRRSTRAKNGKRVNPYLSDDSSSSAAASN